MSLDYIQRYTVRVDAEIYDEGTQKWLVVSSDEEVDAKNEWEARRKALDHSVKHKIPHVRNMTAITVWDINNRVVGDEEAYMLFPYNPVVPLYMVRQQRKRKFSFSNASAAGMNACAKYIDAYFAYLRQGGEEDFVSWRKAQQLKDESLRPAYRAGETPIEQLLRVSEARGVFDGSYDNIPRL